MSQKLSCKTLLALHHFLWRTGNNQVATLVTSFRTEVDDIVGAFDDIKIMLDDNQRVPSLNECIESMKQSLDIMEVQTGGRLVEDEEGRFLIFLTDEEGKFDTLVFSTRKRT